MSRFQAKFRCSTRSPFGKELQTVLRYIKDRAHMPSIWGFPSFDYLDFFKISSDSQFATDEQIIYLLWLNQQMHFLKYQMKAQMVPNLIYLTSTICGTLIRSCHHFLKDHRCRDLFKTHLIFKRKQSSSKRDPEKTDDTYQFAICS